ncbi:MAG: HEAT repeat domain-containing protein [Planctomycetota bacterium]
MSAHPCCTTAHFRRAAWVAAWACLLIAVLPAQAPDDEAEAPSAALQALREELELLVRDPDPLVRGEAALGLSLGRDPKHYPAILKVASDRAPEARLRGIVALGYLAAPGAEAFLGKVLLDSGRPEHERAAAAMALGLLPDDHSTPALDEYLLSVRGGSYRRHRGVLAALLSGMVREPHPSKAQAVMQLLLDQANREQELRRLGSRLLEHTPSALGFGELRDWLRSSDATDRLAAIEALRLRPEPWPAALADMVMTCAKDDRDSRVRAVALAALTDVRDLAALELGARALRSRSPSEVAAGVRAARRLGGGALRTAMEARIMATRSAELQAAMLRAYGSSASERFTRACLQIAGDQARPLTVRVEAAALVGRSGDGRAGAALAALFETCEDARQLEVLAAAVRRLDPALVDGARIHPPATARDVRLLPTRLEALLRSGHPLAVPLLATAVLSDTGSPRSRANLIAAWRRAASQQLPSDLLEQIPAPLRQVL